MSGFEGCRICGSGTTVPFLRRSGVPVHQNLLLLDSDAARGMACGNLTMRFCADCGFVYNSSFEPSLVRYGQDYDNTQTYSEAFNEHVEELVQYMLYERGVKQSRVVEVGCGKGLFIRKLVEPLGCGNTGHGFDPTYVGPDRTLDGRLCFQKRFYDESAADVPADAVVCRHVIEHVPDPLQLLRSVRLALRTSPRARVFFETPCVEWILKNGVIWDFFYEHCSLFTAQSLVTAFELAGFQVELVRHVFGGQYLWLEATIREGVVPEKDAGEVPSLARAFAEGERRRRESWVGMVLRLATDSRVALWGAGAKGVTFANLVDPDRQMIHCVVDINPLKQGKFLAGTGHPIIRPELLSAEGVGTILLLNPNYYCEITKFVKEKHLNIQVIDLMRESEHLACNTL